MRSQEYLKVLEDKHRTLDKEIQTGYNKRLDDLLLEKMKLKKLKIKEEIERLKSTLSK